LEMSTTHEEKVSEEKAEKGEVDADTAEKAEKVNQLVEQTEKMMRRLDRLAASGGALLGTKEVETLSAITLAACADKALRSRYSRALLQTALDADEPKVCGVCIRQLFANCVSASGIDVAMRLGASTPVSPALGARRAASPPRPIGPAHALRLSERRHRPQAC